MGSGISELLKKKTTYSQTPLEDRDPPSCAYLNGKTTLSPCGGQLTTIKMFTQYVFMTWEGSVDKQKKALQMFTSREIVNVKTLVNEQVAYAKAI